MAIIYLSKNGSNANNGSTLALAKRTMYDAGANQGAHEAATAGDTILIDDGVYGAAEIESSAGIGYYTVTKSITLDSVNPYGATLASSSISNGAIRASGAGLGGATVTLGKLNLTGDSVTLNYGITINVSAGPFTFNIGDAKVTAAIYGVYVTAANTIEVHVTSNGCELNAGYSGFYAQTLGNNSTVDLIEPIVNCLGKTTASPAIAIKATGSGVQASVVSPVITVTHAAGFPANQDTGISILNIDNALIYNPVITATTASSVGTINAAVIDCDSGTLTANRGKIIGGNLTLDTNGGIAAVIGHDTSSAGNDRCNFGLIRGVKVNGGSKFRAGSGHSTMLSYNQDGLQVANQINGAGLGPLLKATTRGRAVGNSVKNCSVSYLQFKGCTSSTSDGNECYLDNTTGVGLSATVNGAVNNATCTASGNVFHVNADADGLLIGINASQDVIPYQSIFNVLTGATLATNVCSVNGTNYTDIASYIAAVETSAEVIEDYVVPSSIGYGSSSGLYLEVAPGINLPL